MQTRGEESRGSAQQVWQIAALRPGEARGLDLELSNAPLRWVGATGRGDSTLAALRRAGILLGFRYDLSLRFRTPAPALVSVAAYDEGGQLAGRWEVRAPPSQAGDFETATSVAPPVPLRRLELTQNAGPQLSGLVAAAVLWVTLAGPPPDQRADTSSTSERSEDLFSGPPGPADPPNPEAGPPGPPRPLPDQGSSAEPPETPAPPFAPPFCGPGASRLGAPNAERPGAQPDLRGIRPNCSAQLSAVLPSIAVAFEGAASGHPLDPRQETQGKLRVVLDLLSRFERYSTGLGPTVELPGQQAICLARYYAFSDGDFVFNLAASRGPAGRWCQFASVARIAASSRRSVRPEDTAPRFEDGKGARVTFSAAPPGR